MTVERSGAVTRAGVVDGAGAVAASGYAAERPGAFVYDRIQTAPDHRRRGLGSVVMATLRDARRSGHAVELLTATEEGRALYGSLGWRTLSPYSTAVRR